MEKLNKKHKDNFDDDNKMEEYKFDPNDYCRLCNGHLRGIRHMADCQRMREKESENNTKIANNKLLRRPLELGVSKDENERDKTAKNETK